MAMFAFSFIVLVVIAVSTFTVLWYQEEERVTRRKLRKTPVRSIADMIEHGGLGKIVGEVRPIDDPLEAPLSGRSCVVFHVDVEESQTRTTGGKQDKHWVRIAGEYKGTKFLIEDESGKAIVDAEYCRFAIDRDHKSRSGLLKGAEERERNFLDARGISTKGALLPKALRFKEGVLEVGETVAVLGGGFAQPDPGGQGAGAYRERPAMRLVVSGSPGYPLLISDNTGVLD